MKRNTFLTLAFLLAVGTGLIPVPLHAKYTDPFGKVNDSKYQYTMNITGYVRFIKLVDGEWSPANDKLVGVNTVVAAYCGDELRGKGYTADYNGKYFSLLMMTIYGENKDKLYFKVFIPDNPADLTPDENGEADPETPEPLPVAPGRIIEFAATGFTFKSDTRLGKATDPYYVEVPEPVSTTFSAEGWATTCLPFDAQVPDGVTLWNATGIEDSELVMESQDGALVLPKNTPVIVQYGQSGGDEQSQPATCEWLSRVVTESAEASSLFTVDSSILKGTTEPLEVDAKSVLTLGHSNKTGEIGFWLFTGTTVSANRAYIADFPAGSRGVRLPSAGGTTGIEPIYDLQMDNLRFDTDAVYDLQGRKIENRKIVNRKFVNRKLPKGVYIVNGRKMLVK